MRFIHHTTMNRTIIVVNYTTKEYFVCSNMDEKQKYMNRLFDFPASAKEMAARLGCLVEECGEPYWAEEHEIRETITPTPYLRLLDFTGLDKVPDCFIE